MPGEPRVPERPLGLGVCKADEGELVLPSFLAGAHVHEQNQIGVGQLPKKAQVYHHVGRTVRRLVKHPLAQSLSLVARGDDHDHREPVAPVVSCDRATCHAVVNHWTNHLRRHRSRYRGLGQTTGTAQHRV